MESRSAAGSPSTTTVVSNRSHIVASSSKSSNFFGGHLQPDTPSKLEDESLLDSGYGSQDSSQAATPDRLGVNENGSDPKERGIELRLSRTKALLSFNDEIDELYTTRFYSIQPTIEPLLFQYVKRKSFLRGSGRHKPMAIRLLLLGNSELDAKPHIVIFCAPEMRKRVQHFFEKDELVKELYKPEDKSLPSFEVAVCECAPQLRNGELVIEVFCDEASSAELTEDLVNKAPRGTFCGTPIRLEANGKTRNATLGGLLKLEYDNGRIELLGLTAGHAARACLGDEDDHDLPDGDLDAGDSTDSSFVDSDSDWSQSDSEGAVAEDADSLPSIKEAVEGSGDSQSWAFKHAKTLGNIKSQGDAAQDEQREKGSFDWALINMSDFKPNRLPASGFEENSNQRNLNIASYRNVSPAMAGALSEERVVLLCGSGRPKFGCLAPQPARILVDTSGIFVDAFMVVLDPGDEIVDGDSGSWVVTEKTREVIGHVVATDPLGAGYIIPLCDIFSDIQRSLGVARVSLPSVSDIEEQLQHICVKASEDTKGHLQPLGDAENAGNSSHCEEVDSKHNEEQSQPRSEVNICSPVPPEVAAVPTTAALPLPIIGKRRISTPDPSFEHKNSLKDTRIASEVSSSPSAIPYDSDKRAEGRRVRRSAVYVNDQRVVNLSSRGRENGEWRRNSRSSPRGQRIVLVDSPPAPQHLEFYTSPPYVPVDQSSGIVLSARNSYSTNNDSGYSSYGGSSRNSPNYGSISNVSTTMTPSTGRPVVVSTRAQTVDERQLDVEREDRRRRRRLEHIQSRSQQEEEEEKRERLRARIEAANAIIASRPPAPRPPPAHQVRPSIAFDDTLDESGKDSAERKLVEAVRQLNLEAQRQRLVSRMTPRRPASLTPEGRRRQFLDDEGVDERH